MELDNVKASNLLKLDKVKSSILLELDNVKSSILLLLANEAHKYPKTTTAAVRLTTELILRFCISSIISFYHGGHLPSQCFRRRRRLHLIITS